MGIQTYEQMTLNVREIRMGNRTDVTPQRLLEWSNASLLRVANEFEHVELEGEVDETVALGLDRLAPVTTDIWWPVNLKNGTEGGFLQPWDKEWIDHQRTKPTSTPRRYYWWRRTFVFDTFTNQATTIHLWYIKKPVYWTTGTSPLDSLYDLLVEVYTALAGFNALRDFKNAHFCETEANNWIAYMNLPKRKAKLDDYRTGIQVRTKG